MEFQQGSISSQAQRKHSRPQASALRCRAGALSYTRTCLSIMDHLPCPESPFRQYPAIRYICGTQFALKGAVLIRNLEDFGYEQQAFLKGAKNSPELREASPFLQAWLWFGTLRGIFETVNVPLTHSDFVKHDEQHRLCLSTAHLHRYLWYWMAAESLASEQERQDHLRMIQGYIKNVYDVLQCYTVRKDVPESPEIQSISKLGPYVADDDSNVLLSIVVLAEALEHAKEAIYGIAVSSFSWDESLAVRIWLIGAGWCINEIVWLTNQLTNCHASGLAYVSCINRHVSVKDHSKCSLERCVLADIDYETYKPVHTTQGCSCHDVSLQYGMSTEMDSLVREGAIPLITFPPHAAEKGQLTLQKWVSRGSGLPYVAISHVWLDRLGNLHGNTLPCCQVRTIQQLVNSLYPSLDVEVPLWIDTICVPRNEVVRRLAINNMRHVYSEADKVLVLDSSLRQIHSTAAPEELLLRIKFSPWSTRLWTFHESALSGRLCFQLKDTAVFGDTLERRYLPEIGRNGAVVSLVDLQNSGPYEHLNRALCRAMSFDDQGKIFDDLTQAASLPRDDDLEVIYDRASSHSENHGVEEDAKSTDSAEDEDDKDEDDDEDEESDDTDSSIDWNDPVIANNPVLTASRARTQALREETEASKARTRAMRERIAMLNADTKALKARSASYKEQSCTLDEKIMGLVESSPGGLQLRQTRPDMYTGVRAEWLSDTPTPADEKLRADIRRLMLQRSGPLYWLHIPEPIFLEGYISYANLRLAYKRLAMPTKVDGMPDAKQVEEAIGAIAWRTTSWPGDEAICLAIILDLDVARVQQHKGVSRMRELASMLENTSRELVFFDTPKFEEYGYRWMPKSFLGTGLDSSGVTGEAHRTVRGLRFRAAGIICSASDIFLAVKMIGFATEGRYYIATITGRLNSSWDTFGGNKFAIVFEDDLGQRNSTKAVGSSCEEMLDGVWYVRYEVHVRVISVDDLSSCSYVLQEFEPTPSGQEWCIA